MVVRTEALALERGSMPPLASSDVLALAAPDREFHPGLDMPAFHAVANDRNLDVFPDGKMLTDSLPLDSISEINLRFAMESGKPGFDPNEFWKNNFEVPTYSLGSDTMLRRPDTVDQYIAGMWNELTYHHEIEGEGSAIRTPRPHLKPGERFGEGCYWDLADGVSGLLAEARADGPIGRNNKENLVLGVAVNLVDQINQQGYVFNGFRTYYEGRSQPPVFAGIVKEMARHFGDRQPNLVEEYLPALTAEYEWWMRGEDQTEQGAQERVVRLEDGAILNRHWDANDTPRPESYAEDIKTARLADGVDVHAVFRHLRAAAESGKDFTARFMVDPERLDTIHTTDFVTPELNSLLWEYETMIAEAHDSAGRSVLAQEFHDRADRRQAAMDKYLWNEADGCYYDYDFVHDEQSRIKSMATAYPVARGAASPEQGFRVAEVLQKDLLKRGGFVSAAIESDQQWDAPNGFARDQVEGVNALVRADSPWAEVAIRRWLNSDDQIFAQYGVLLEKTNVIAPQAEAGHGGEYAVQRGFLWTNGVHRVMQGLLGDMRVSTATGERIAA